MLSCQEDSDLRMDLEMVAEDSDLVLYFEIFYAQILLIITLHLCLDVVACAFDYIRCVVVVCLTGADGGFGSGGGGGFDTGTVDGQA